MDQDKNEDTPKDSRAQQLSEEAGEHIKTWPGPDCCPDSSCFPPQARAETRNRDIDIISGINQDHTPA